MLVLTSLANEEIVIGDDIRITVVAVNGNQVRIGITAPRHMTVHRREVYEAICGENLKAAEVTPEGLRERLHRGRPHPPIPSPSLGAPAERSSGDGENGGGFLPPAPLPTTCGR